MIDHSIRDINLKDLERMDRAREQAALAIRLQFNPRYVPDLIVARALADAVIGEWLRVMAGERGR